ncbi:nuclear transport factor 2 family protein [Roseiconus nitratireducens]|uniref:Nuclear transport factor 2 family protein n=1 Tax=Roseiconus nitratireducens TaxID=2605748 RepID=A0A5M6D466_9BACT|nr:nuclear transport factor 2 family protein [Roseiconus nitratireducens]KAA5542271.1 nuclear transport factor 2 family protein [Roseiconus nitratireducens]
MFRQALCLLFLVAAIPSSETFADHHEPGQVESAVKTFYSQLSSGEFEKAMGHTANGSSGYVAKGGLTEIGSDEVRQQIVKMLKDGQERGAEMELRPKDIKVTVHGDVAIATYMVDAAVKGADQDESEEQVNRGTLVWAKQGDDWKILHWHVSEFVPNEQ